MELPETQRLLLESGKRWFLEKGFKSAPLRSIVKDTGYTLGAFYGYYETKEALFYALTDETARQFTELLSSISSDMMRLPPEERLYRMMDCYIERLPEIASFVCGHREELRLILRCSEGTRYEHFVDSLAAGNRQQLQAAADAAARAGAELSHLDSATLDYLMQGYFDTLVRIMLEVEDPAEICRIMREIGLVYKEGMLRLMTTSCPC